MRDKASGNFILVIPADPAQAVAHTTLAGKSKPGRIDRNFKPGEPKNFVPVVEVPKAKAYLVFDVDRGEEYRNVRPEDAVAAITARGRSPLTIEEGLALITHHPEMLEKNKCFMLAGSRCGDRRVPALWISEGAPKLGWCWAGNPHTWLGTASAASRLG
ncbi:hypothetical protein Rhe02_21990 [Rhizocola hellebori]|uniref:Uncharacterized protein n=1 Tax=Rhizocola hellebori TaxID=1392758 RepID=A0A8J3Q6E6_9ACTN|nr:hypothetical protein Rhe02_21990 [Rhizocola hellebori]